MGALGLALMGAMLRQALRWHGARRAGRRWAARKQRALRLANTTDLPFQHLRSLEVLNSSGEGPRLQAPNAIQVHPLAASIEALASLEALSRSHAQAGRTSRHHTTYRVRALSGCSHHSTRAG